MAERQSAPEELTTSGSGDGPQPTRPAGAEGPVAEQVGEPSTVDSVPVQPDETVPGRKDTVATGAVATSVAAPSAWFREATEQPTQAMRVRPATEPQPHAGDAITAQRPANGLSAAASRGSGPAAGSIRPGDGAQRGQIAFTVPHFGRYLLANGV